jgi:YidC/Oxa1 family membrane protein insertase
MEKRLLLAFVLSALIFAGWSVIFPPPAPPVAPVEKATVSGEVVGVVESPTPQRVAIDAAADEVAEEVAEETAEEAVVGEIEQTIRLKNDVVEVELSNRGALVTAMRLLQFDDDEGKVLDLVQSVPAAGDAKPLQLMSEDGLDSRLYRVERTGDTVAMTWADGEGTAVYKTIELGAGYGLEVAVRSTGALANAAISAGTGLRNLGEQERNSRLAVWGDGVVLADGELEKFKKAKVKVPVVLRPGVIAYAGLEDAYFINLLRPMTRVEEVRIDRLEFTEQGDPTKEPKLNQALRILLVPSNGVFEGELLGVPKEYTLLESIGGGMEKTLDLGIFGFISIFFLKALWWIYSLVGNYGVAIILLTVGIRIVLFPLMHTSTVSMRKMAKVQPRVKEIQTKYKKKNDPQARSKMSQETMALYKEEGVNPMAGCLPVLVQLPILWALYQLFLHAIELRHAPFIFWIQDLSAKDPYYVTPILMTATMWLQQKLAPQAGDPQQQKIMRMLPLVFGIMFLQFPSGLVLYWLTNNVISILQQEITLFIIGERKYLGRMGGRKSK